MKEQGEISDSGLKEHADRNKKEGEDSGRHINTQNRTHMMLLKLDVSI